MKRRGLRVLTLMLLVVLAFIGCRVNQPCQVKIVEPENGDIYLTENLSEKNIVEKYAKLNFTADPKEGYVVGSWIIKGADILEGGKPGNKTAKIKVTGDLELSVLFVKVYSVSFNVHGGNGTLEASDGESAIESSTIESISAGTEITFTATANSHYEVNFWTVTGGNLTSGGVAGATTAVVEVTGNVTVSVSFKNTYDVTFSVDGENGSLEASSGANTYNSSPIADVSENTEITFTATPDADYLVDSWTITGGVVVSGGAAGETTAVVRITESVTVSVSFVIKTYNVVFSVAEGKGNLKVSYGANTYTSSPIEDVPVNTEVTFIATEDEEYLVDSWTITGGSFTSGGGDGDKTAVVFVNSNINVEVSFAYTFPEKTFTVGGISFTMKKVDDIENVTLGDDEQELNKSHEVSLSEYWIGEIEVTQELWQEVMVDDPSYFSSEPALGEDQGKRPVENIDWCECIAFCNELTKRVYGEEECVYYKLDDNEIVYDKTDAAAYKDPFFDINSTKKGFRLPTEAEWEYAAKGGEDYTYSGSNTIGDVAWYRDNSNNKTHQVKKLAANGYGLYDMSGNVGVWCFDKSHDSEDGSLQPVAGKDPVGENGDSRVVRGSYYGVNESNFDLIYRYIMESSCTNPSIGLRLACRF